MNEDRGDKQSDNGVAQALAVGVGGTVIGGGLVATILNQQYRKPILVLIVVMLVLGCIAWGLFQWLRARRRKANAAGLGADVEKEIERQSAASNDGEVKSRLEQLKRKFMLLPETLQREGHRNIYEIPWFLTLGPSGSGKSWVLKGSNLQLLGDDPWDGGTLMIDWWTHKDAIVLDSAGGLVFSEEKRYKGYDSPEWQSLLALLKKHRPQCPINGLLVMVPAQLLWLKEDELPPQWLNLNEYADALRDQIRKRLQRDLRIRFPVYFLVTQCDRVPGFREFADSLEANGRSKEQMLGWSIPVEVGKMPRKSPGTGGSDLELEEIKVIDRSLHEVAANLRRQRLELLRKYAADGARADELGMDVRRRAAELFVFPDSIESTLAPRLKEFLETVFKPDPTLPKTPPYLRGVYFTSSMREGEVLDRQRAAGVGQSLANLALPGGADGKQPNPFFLKDLIFKKAFPEFGLVTPLTEARAYLKQRHRTLILSGIGVALLLLLAIGIGGCSYQTTVVNQLKHWEDASKAPVQNAQYWLPVLKIGADQPQVDTNNITLLADLAKASAEFESSGFWSFRWLFSTRKLDESRHQALLHLFERGVLGQMADLARQKILNSTNAPIRAGENQADENMLDQESKQFEAGFLAVLELELCPTNRSWKETDWQASRNRVLSGLVNYLLAGQKDAAPAWALGQFKDICGVAYHRRTNQWPPAKVKEPDALPNLTAAAFARFGQMQANRTEVFKDKGTNLRKLVEEANNIAQKEKELLDAMEKYESVSSAGEDIGTLASSWRILEKELSKAQVQVLGRAFTNFAEEVVTNANDHYFGLRQRMEQVTGAGSGTNLHPILARGFASLTGDLPKYSEMLDRFTDVTNTATVLDAGLLRRSIPTAKDGRAAVGPQPSMSQRLDVYAQVTASNFSSTVSRRWDRDLGNLLEDWKPKSFQDLLQEISTAASRDCHKLPSGPFSDLTNGDLPYIDIVCKYVEFRYFENLLQGVGKRIGEALEEAEFKLKLDSDNQDPKEMLRKAGKLLTKLNNYTMICAELKGKCNSLARHKALVRVEEEVNTKRGSVLKTILDEIGAESSGPRRFPLDPKGEKLLEERELLNFRKRANSWLAAISDLPNEAKSIPDESVKEWKSTITGEWLTRLSQLVDDKGDILDYEVITPPWNDADTLKNWFPDDTDLAKATKAAGVYKSWKIGGKSLDAASPKGKVTVSAASGFSIEVRKDDQNPPAKIVAPPRSDGWTIISMIARPDRRSRVSNLYLVPIQVTGARDQEPEVVYFGVRPVPSVNFR